jgi:tetratricopeptide (TPR) repeat protein
MYNLEQFTARCKSLLSAGSYEDVIRISLERLEAIPDDFEAVLFMAEAKLRISEIAEAKSLLNLLCHRMLFLSRVYKLLGDAYQTDDPELAKDYYRRYVAMNPQSDEALEIQAQLESGLTDGENGELNSGFRTVTMADLMIKQGHLDSAMEILNEILNHDPENKQALDRIAKIQLIRELEKWRKSLFRKRPDQ